MTISEASIGGPALVLDPDAIASEAAEILEELCGVAPERKWDGASIPVLTSLARASAAPGRFWLGSARKTIACTRQTSCSPWTGSGSAICSCRKFFSE